MRNKAQCGVTVVVLSLFVLLLGTVPVQAGGCGFSVPMFHGMAGKEKGGAFDLQGTQYDGKPGPGPKFRFWAFKDFQEANSGTENQYTKPDMAWLANAALDPGWNPKEMKPYQWVLSQANWFGANVDGCIRSLKDEVSRDRCVLEISFADDPNEGTPKHRGFYLIVSVPFSPQDSGFDFDVLRGGIGPNLNQIRIAPVPVPEPVLSAGKVNSKDKTTMDVALKIPDAASFGEKGKNLPLNLIKGYKILYALDSEPVSSKPESYKVAMLPESPDNPHAMIPFGAGEAKVTVPIPKKAVWFVAQIVYEDPTAEVLSLGTSGNSKPVGPPGAPMKEKKPSKTTTKTSEGTK